MPVPAADRESSPRHRAFVGRALAGLLVALLAALTPQLSAVPAGAARVSGRAAAESTATATAQRSATSQESRRGLRPIGLRPSGVSGRRLVSKAAAPRHVQHQQRGSLHAPICPGTGSADPTGPPSTYAVATIRPTDRPLCGPHHPAAAGRAPPNSCGS